MSELFTSGSVGGGAGNRPFYPAADPPSAPVIAAKNAKIGYNQIIKFGRVGEQVTPLLGFILLNSIAKSKG